MSKTKIDFRLPEKIKYSKFGIQKCKNRNKREIFPSRKGNFQAEFHIENVSINLLAKKCRIKCSCSGL